MAAVELGGSAQERDRHRGGPVGPAWASADNTRSALMTRGWPEIVRLGLAAGARLETFMGLSGIGRPDRHRRSGLSAQSQFRPPAGRGLSCEDALKKVAGVESKDTPQAAVGS